MLKFYLDHTEFRVNPESERPDTLLIGGLLINDENERRLSQIIREIKTRFVHPELPIKYNLKDLKSKYEEFNLASEFAEFLHHSYEWRKELVTRSLDVPYTAIIAVVQNFQIHKKHQKNIRPDLIGYSFADLLMRVGLEAQKHTERPVELIIDWPESNDPKPFNNQYYYGYWRGKTPDGQDYYSGTLRSNGFHDTVLFASMNHSNMLQFADIIIGSARDFLSTHIDEREYSIGKELMEIMLPKFRGFPKNINYGISVSSSNTELKERIAEIMKPYIA